jgi:hypothetical protein
MGRFARPNSEFGKSGSIGRLRVRQDFRVPRGFWKVLFTASGRGVEAAAFMVDQTEFLKDPDIALSWPEAVSDWPRYDAANGADATSFSRSA